MPPTLQLPRQDTEPDAVTWIIINSMSHIDELRSIAALLQEATVHGGSPDVTRPLAALEAGAQEIDKAFSGSWLGYHSRVYYANFLPPPAGARFSLEWGLMRPITSSSRGDWREYSADQVAAALNERSNVANLDIPRSASEQAERIFDGLKAEILSIIETELAVRPDSHVSRLKTELEALRPLTAPEIANEWAPKGQRLTRDTEAASVGNEAPAHSLILAQIAAIRHAFEICERASELSTRMANHLQRKATANMKGTGRIESNVVIGHGRSQDWRALKDFLQDRLKLKCDEFNRIPVAGLSTVTRLSQMLDSAAFAFLVMTPEDEMEDGTFHPRMNVVHESGLFQGRLGFTKAIIVLEDGCAQFSNVEGLGQIRYPKNRISACFEEVRAVLEREGLIEPSE